MRLRQTSNSQIDQMPKQLRCCHICWKWLLDCTYWHQNIARNLLLWFKQEDTKQAISPFRLFWEATCTNCGSQQLKNGFCMIFWHWYVTSLQCTKIVHVVQSIWEPDASIHFWPSLGKQPLHRELCPFSKHVARLGICMGSFTISACRVYTQQRRVGGALVGFTVDYIRSAFRWCFDPFWKKVMHGAQTKIYNWADLLAEKLFDASWCEGSFEIRDVSRIHLCIPKMYRCSDDLHLVQACSEPSMYGSEILSKGFLDVLDVLGIRRMTHQHFPLSSIIQSPS